MLELLLKTSTPLAMVTVRITAVRDMLALALGMNGPGSAFACSGSGMPCAQVGDHCEAATMIISAV